MTTQADVVPGRGGLHRTRRARRGDRGRQRVSEKPVEVADAQRAKDEDRRTNARLAQDDPLFDIRTREHRGARLLERQRDFRRAMAVGVGFHDRDDPGARSDELGDGAEVVADGFEIDARDGLPDHEC